MSSRLMEGVLIVAFVIVANIISAFIIDGSAPTSEFTNCNDTNRTSCQGVGETSFFETLADVTFTGFDGAPLLINAIWLSLMGLLLTAGIILIVLSFLPTYSA